jgi:hypothetical protein
MPARASLAFLVLVPGATLAAQTSTTPAPTVQRSGYLQGRSTRVTLEYVSRKVGEPGVRKSLGLAQAQVVF